MVESILSLICWVWLPALPVSLHHSELRQQSRLYEWTESPPEAGRWHWSHCDVTPETRKREQALWDLPFTPLHLSFNLSFSFSSPQSVLLSSDGLILQADDSSSPPHPRNVSQLSSIALPCPSQLCLPQTHIHWNPVKKIPITDPCSIA